LEIRSLLEDFLFRTELRKKEKRVQQRKNRALYIQYFDHQVGQSLANTKYYRTGFMFLKQEV
jgi:hypothetical protein